MPYSSTITPYGPAGGDFLSMEAYPHYLRPTTGRVVAGVAGGLAAHLRINVLYVRLAFFLSALISGFGVLAYAGLWMWSKTSEEVVVPQSKGSLGRPANLMLVVLALVGFALSLFVVSGLSQTVVVPLLLAGLGALLAWQAYDVGLDSGRGWIRILGGSALVLSGIVITVFAFNMSAGFGTAIVAVGLTLGGAVALGGPLVIKLLDSLAHERAAKAAADERAAIASRLHDSVLQTLALIQKRAEDPEEVARLARGQERELRQWLFEAEEKTSQSIFAAVETACGEVEDLFGMRIAPVTVGGDQELDDSSQAIVLAAREAMINAAKHAGVDSVDVYAEILGGELSIYVRDRGRGFDLENISADRHGIRDSIQARVERAGGSVEITSNPVRGTEVILRLPLAVS